MGALDRLRGHRPSSWLSSWDNISRDMERIYRDMESTFAPMRSRFEESMEFVPTCDIDESEDEYFLSMDVPGVERDDIDIRVEGNSIKVSGEKRHEKEEKRKDQYRLERSYGKFSRTFTLPQAIKEEGIEAHYSNGVLSLTVPKVEAKKAKRITIKEGKPGFVARLAGKGREKAANE